MKTLKFTLTSLAILSLAACSTVPEDTLLAGIPADKISAAPTVGSAAGGAGSGLSIDGVPTVSAASRLAESQIRASASNPTCAQFNVNTLAFSAKPETPGFGTGLLKTIALGTIAGFASGGVASLGISSSFLEATAIGTTNQVVFSSARPLVDKVIPDGTYAGSEKAIAIKESAERVGCPNPTWAGTLSPKEAAVLSAKLNAESKAAKKAGISFDSGISTPSVTTPTLTAPTLTTPALSTPIPTQSLPVSCPAGTTAQPGGSCLVTGNFGG